MDAAFTALGRSGYTYEKENAFWFATEQLGDDKDRVLKKSDGSLTYFATDIAYHHDKFERGYDWLIDIWGADHHGYVPAHARGHYGHGQATRQFRRGPDPVGQSAAGRQAREHVHPRGHL